MTSFPAPIDKLDISLRAYAVPCEPKKERNGTTNKAAPPSPWTVAFDTETTTDKRQALRFGTYQVMDGTSVHEKGLFFASDLPPHEIDLLRKYADENGLTLRTHGSFVDDVFYRFGYDLRGRIVGFNLPFDLSRIAIRCGPARGGMYGGFSLTLSEKKYRPAVQVKHLSGSSARIQFTAPYKARDGRSVRNRGQRTPIRRGFFVDIGTLASALFAKRFSLEGLCEFLGVTDGKLQTKEHGGPLTGDYIAYAVRDTEATWACYAELATRYEKLGLPTPDYQIQSEAGIGKAHFSAMGVQPWQKMQPDVPPDLLATILATYFGGRSEVRIRRQQARVVLCDFLSMYPTVGVLQGLWKFVCAQGMNWRDGTTEARAFLDRVTLGDMQDPAIWPQLTALVQIQPDRDIVPVRAQYDDEAANTIGLNHLLSEDGVWLTLADCVASKLIKGRMPIVRKALIFQPGELQRGLQPVRINGMSDYTVDPRKEDFFKRVIELRQQVKGRMSGITGRERDSLAAAELALKIIANATGYGCYVQVNVREHAKPIAVRVYNTSGEPFEVRTFNEEQPGPFFHPLLATLITGAARLMLAITERLDTDRGLGWAFCDTDSMALAKPSEMDDEAFLTKVRSIVDWFAGLNPYDFSGSILKVEKENFSLDDRTEHEPLYVWAVSAKRYALFNLAPGGELILRKLSAHGLGHLVPPYDEHDPARSVPAPKIDLAVSGVARWHHDLWWQIVRAALDGHPDQVDLEYHPAFSEPAMSRYAATTPKLLAWFKRANEGLPYQEQVKAFNFMFSLFADPFANMDGAESTTAGRGLRKGTPRPAALFDRDHQKAIGTAFDRDTDDPVSPDQLQSYRAALALYHLHSEAKFLNGSYADRGTTLRRTVVVDQMHAIGKEANRLEEQFYLGLDEEALVAYRNSDMLPALSVDIKAAADVLGQRELAFRLGLPRATLARLLRGHGTRISRTKHSKLKRELSVLRDEHAQIAAARESTFIAVTTLINEKGLTSAADELGIDPSNLQKVANKKREPSTRLIETVLSDEVRQ